MIFEYKQKERLPLSWHEITENGAVLCTTEIPRRGAGKLFLGKDCFELKVEGLTKPVKILKNSVEYGTLTPKIHLTKKVLFLNTGYQYYELSFPFGTYLVYESGFGGDKHFYSIYKDDTVLAVIHKHSRVVNYLDSYTCYLENREDFFATIIYCLFLESVEYYDMSVQGNNVDYRAVETAQQELKDKYDPTFIPRIRQKEGYTD